MANTKISDFPRLTVSNPDDVIVLDSGLDGQTKSLKVSDLTDGINSSDSTNVIKQGTDGALSVEVADTISADSGNLIEQGTDNGLLIDSDSLISTDADNTLEAGSDGKLYNPPSSLPDGAVTTPKLADSAVTAIKINSESATDGQVLTADGAGGVAFEDLNIPSATVGTEGVIALTNAFDAQSGTNATKAIVPTTLHQAMIGSPITQEWEIPSRSGNTTYTNNTGRPIMVNITTESGGSPQTFTVTNNSGAPIVVAVLDGITNGAQTISAIVPDGRSYRLNGTDFDRWVELR